MNLPVTNVPGCIGSNAKPRGMQLMQVFDIDASDGPPHCIRIVHHGADELLIQ